MHPHLGADEFEEYKRMTEKNDNLWLDTTMTLADYLPIGSFPELRTIHATGSYLALIFRIFLTHGTGKIRGY